MKPIFFRGALQHCRAWHRYFADLVVSYPIVLILLVAVYLPATIGMAFLCGLTGKVLVLAMSFVLATGRYAAYEVAQALFFVLAPCVWLHYFWLGLRCFRAAIGLRMTVYAVVQLVAVTVFIFSAAHYYTALFSEDGQTQTYKGIANPRPEQGWGDAADFDDRLFFWPSLDTVIDFLYFSTVTTATVGYGDITPVTRMAKLVTMAHIGISFVLIVVILGWVIGNAKSLADQAARKRD